MKKTVSTSVSTQTLAAWFDTELKSQSFKDYCPNGLQVEGKKHIRHLISAVTASQRAIEQAIDENADALLVHHGLFWRNDNMRVVGMLKNRLHALMRAQVNLFAFHLPLDAHSLWGNNVQLGRVLGLDEGGATLLQGSSVEPLVFYCDLQQALSLAQLVSRVKRRMKRTPIVVEPLAGLKAIRRVVWCTGGAQGYIDVAARLGADVFISGEISEQTTHVARELGVAYIAAGHHATERYGVQALGVAAAENFGIHHQFVDDNNPA